MLLMHGDKDQTVPFTQSQIMASAAAKAGTTVRFIPLKGGSHRFPAERAEHPDWPNLGTEVVSWLDQYVRSRAATAR